MSLFRSKKTKERDLSFEESLGEEWSRELDIREVSIGSKPLFLIGAFAIFIAFAFVSRIVYLNFWRGGFYEARSEANQAQIERISAPRGQIFDREGKILAENHAVFIAELDAKEFLKNKDLQEKTLKAAETILYLPSDEVWNLVKESSDSDYLTPVILGGDLSQSQLVDLESLSLPTIIIRREFERNYAGNGIFSSVVGYIGRVNQEDLQNNPNFNGEDFLGRGGVELFYDDTLRGKFGTIERKRDAKGNILSAGVKEEPKNGGDIKLTVDGAFQEYFYQRMREGLISLGRRIGVGLAIDPRNGEVLAMINFPGYDNNLLSGTGRNEEKNSVLTSSERPLFNRAISGAYTPGSTIKPLVGIAVLKEGVMNSTRKIFSPGYLDIPNPYDPEAYSRYGDWRYQGIVDLSSAIAQSSNVYFYIAGGGAPKGVDPQILAGGGYVSGLGINRLNSWWQKFLLGKKTGIDLPGETEGFLPTPQWKEEKTGKPWLLGDTYNVSIGQGDLLLTPVQLLNYISSVANGGKIYEPSVNLNREHPKLLTDLSYLLPEIKEVRKGMEEAVTSQLGTAHLLSGLGFRAAAKTGTSEVRSKKGENAFFVGYAPAENPQVAILILVENSLEGSLNTVPIAKDVLDWYYWNRVRK